MTDKQIIIDGIDVSGCEYYFDKKCRCMDASIMQDFYSCPQCNSTPNCYYKQLKRAENQIVELNKTIKAKEQECEGLKEKYKKYYQITLDDELQINGLHKVLQEIKEIAEENKETTQYRGICLSILQKINECEGK